MKRTASQAFGPSEKQPLVDYSSSEEEMPEQSTAATPVAADAHPLHARPWRATVEESSDEESQCDAESEDEPLDEEEPTSHTEQGVSALLTESMEPVETLNLEALNLERKTLPWDRYQGIPEERFAAARHQMGGNPLGPLFEFNFLPVSRKQWMRRVEKTIYTTKLKQRRDPSNNEDVGVGIVNAMEESTRQHLDKIGANKEDRVFLAMTPNGFEHTYQTTEFTVGEFKAGSTRLEELLRKLAGKLNSNQSFHPDQGFQLDLTLVRPFGTGSGREKGLNPGRMGYLMSRQTKNSIIWIKNSDELCCARAIVTLKARAEWKVTEKKVQEEERKEVPDQVLLQELKEKEKDQLTEYNTLRRTSVEKRKPTLQLIYARQLHRLAGVPEGPCGLEEVKRFQVYLSSLTPPFQLKVFCDQTHKPLFTGPLKVDKEHILFLLKSNHHFDGITSLKGFFNRSYWCDTCDRAFNTDDPAHHSCLGQHCYACGGNPCPNRFQKRDVQCEDCHGLFYGADCYRVHRNNGTCEKYKTCTICFVQYQVDKEHTCGHAKCNNCKEVDDMAEHRCHIQPVEEEEEGGKPPLFVYADIEAMTLPDRTFEPNLLCYQTSQERSIIRSLKGKGCCHQFIKELNKLAWVPAGKKKRRERPVIVLFHNLKGFDGVFILNALYKDGRKVENQFSMGAKVLTFKCGPLTFKDSLCFLPFPLSAFPATFGIKELKKGYFPHAFNTPEHQDYVGSIPAKTYYDPEGMKDKDKVAFEKWYAEQHGEFDLKKELEEYCRSDVALLKAGCEAFVAQFKQEADFNPFEKCATIASACNLYWRRSIEEGSDAAKIAVRPLRGWHGAQVNQSRAALEWLTYKENLLPHEGVAAAEKIRHARNGGEKRLWLENGAVHVDGWDGETAYEFLGCLWHGCPRCYPHKRDMRHAIMPDKSPNEAHRATLEKIRRLEEKCAVESIWECDWSRKKQEDAGVRRFVEQLVMVDPLEPRDAFFGGRTGAVALHHHVSPGEKIYYVDVTSLYPWVNKTCEYPLGNPIIIFNPTVEEFPDYFGLAKVTILPPSKLFHPVLPVRSGGKLTFPLCAACVRDEQGRPLLKRSATCRHSKRERMLQGTWCTPEINEALKVGYELKEVHEVWHFEETASGLFAEYVDTWLKIKTEASGWPKDCETEEEKRGFIERFEEKEGIRLQYENVKKNTGLKATAKLMLNSFWGKFGQRENLPQVEQCTSPNQLYDIMGDDSKQVTDIRFCNDDVLEVVYTYKEEAIIPNNCTNIFVAAFTTCWARLKLYSYLQTLGEQVLYYDTDSVIYKWSAGLPKVLTGDFLGDLKDELDGDVIEEFVSGGAKNYGYRTVRGKTECKVRGFTLNVRGKEVLNFDSMKRGIMAVLKEKKEEPHHLDVTNPSHFKRDTTTKGVSRPRSTDSFSISG